MMILSKTIIGLDIQVDGFRLVERSLGRGIKKLLYQPFPSSIYQERRVIDWQTLRLMLTKWVVSLRLSAKKTALALPANVVRMQKMQLPVGLNAVDIKAEIAAQLHRDLPGLQEKLAIDFITPNTHESTGYTNIFFAATKEALLLPYLECVKAAGLIVSAVDIDLYALKRAMCKAAASAMILQVNSRGAQLVVFQDEEIVFHEQYDVSFSLISWLENVLMAVQHLSVSNRYLIGSSDVLESILMIGDLNKWQLSPYAEGFEIAAGLAMRGQA